MKEGFGDGDHDGNAMLCLGWWGDVTRGVVFAKKFEERQSTGDRGRGGAMRP